LKFAGEGVIF
jgi:hypothetical protein